MLQCVVGVLQCVAVCCSVLQCVAYAQPIAFGVSFNPILQSLSSWSLFNGTCQKRKRDLENSNRVSSSLGRKRDLQKEIYKRRFAKRDLQEEM